MFLCVFAICSYQSLDTHLALKKILLLMILPGFPAHPAGSFHYPSLPRLPILAQYSVIKLREYELEREFPTGRENIVRGEASKYNKYSMGGLNKEERGVEAKYKYNIGGLNNEREVEAKYK